MPAVPIIRLNGRVFTRQSVSVRPNGAFRLAGIDSINWADERPQELVSGMNEGGVPLGKATGNYGCSADMSIYLDEVLNFETSLLLLNPLAGTDITQVTFQLPIMVREDARVHTVTMVNCSIKGRDMAVGNDGSALVRKYTLQPLYIVENGLGLANLLPSL